MATLHRVVKGLDVAAFARALGGWLAASGVTASEALTLDGKTVHGRHGDAVPGGQLVAAAHRSGAGLGPAPRPGMGQEVAVVTVGLAAAPLAGWTVTGDAVLTQTPVAEAVMAGGGDDLMVVKDTETTLAADLATLVADPDAPTRQAEAVTAHGGRYERRCLLASPEVIGSTPWTGR